MPHDDNIKNQLKDTIRDIPDNQKKGTSSKDITTILQDGNKFKQAVDLLVKRYRIMDIDVVVCVESRGFLFGAALAYNLNAAVVPVRKEGKLPCATHSVIYDLEYSTAKLEIHKDSIKKGDRVLIIDDLLATGSTALATIDLVEKLQGEICEICFLVELTYMKGHMRLQRKNYPIFSLISY
jgi:adenine phosphoribosyltransferase